MANPAVLQVDTILYSAAEPEGRMFPAGSAWPGDAWSSNRGGEPVGKGATAQAMKDLMDAQDRIDALGDQLNNAQHSAAQSDQARSEAEAKVAGLEAEVENAKAAQAAAEAAAVGYMTERDDARSNLQSATSSLASAKTELEAAQAEAAKVPGLVAELETANQKNADLNGEVEKLTADLAAATAPKAAKGVKAGAEPAADAAETPEAT